MLVIDAHRVHEALTFATLIPALRHGFAAPAGTPARSVYRLADADPFRDAFAVLPAWNDEVIGVKAFTYLPSNAPKGRQILHSQILLFDRENGEPRALVDGTSVTRWRTAAIAGLAADLLARPDVERLLICGTGTLAPFLAAAHAGVRRYREIAIWGRSAERAAATVATIAAEWPTLPCRVAGPLEDEARAADTISCATASHDPILLGAWIRPGTHIDCLGNHEASGREVDSDLVVGARVHVDLLANCLREAGEILLPIAEGRITAAHVVGELADLCAGRSVGRTTSTEITCFKSVGTALSDLIAAHLVYRHQIGS